MDLICEHFLCKSGIGAEENGLVHDRIGAGKSGTDGFAVDQDHRRTVGADQAGRVRSIFAELHEDGLAEQVSAEEHAVADLLLVQVAGKIGVAEGRRGLHPEHEAEPRCVGLAAGRVPFEAVSEADIGNLRLEA